MSLVSKLVAVRNAYRAGILSDAQAARWAYRITAHLHYNAEEPQDRLAYRFITR